MGMSLLRHTHFQYGTHLYFLDGPKTIPGSPNPISCSNKRPHRHPLARRCRHVHSHSGQSVIERFQRHDTLRERGNLSSLSFYQCIFIQLTQCSDGQYAILIATLMNSAAKYAISILDIRRASHRGGENAPPWEDKSMWIFYVELATGMFPALKKFLSSSN